MIARSDLRSLRLTELRGALAHPGPEGHRSGVADLKVGFEASEYEAEDDAAGGLALLRVLAQVDARDPEGEDLFALAVAFTMRVDAENLDHQEVIKMLWPMMYAELAVQAARLGVRSTGLPLELEDGHFKPKTAADDSELA